MRQGQKSGLFRLMTFLVRIGLWGFAAFVEIGSLYGACHGGLSMSIVFSVVTLALIVFNRRLQRNVKLIGSAVTLVVFVALIAFSQSPAGKASNGAMKRQEAQQETKDRVIRSEQAKEERKRQGQMAKRDAETKAAQAKQAATDNAAPTQPSPPTPPQKETNEVPSDEKASPEVMLASVQAGRHLDPSDPLVAQFARQLDEVQRKSGESRMGLVEAIGNTHDFMLKRGVDESYLSILTSLNTDLLTCTPKTVPFAK